MNRFEEAMRLLRKAEKSPSSHRKAILIAVRYLISHLSNKPISNRGIIENDKKMCIKCQKKRIVERDQDKCKKCRGSVEDSVRERRNKGILPTESMPRNSQVLKDEVERRILFHQSRITEELQKRSSKGIEEDD